VYLIKRVDLTVNTKSPYTHLFCYSKMSDCILVSGLSGTGKTTLAQYYSIKHGYVFVDGDSFYLKDKPQVTLSDGTAASNWDTADAIDWDSLNMYVKGQLKTNIVVLATFMPRIDMFEFAIFIHISLSFSDLNTRIYNAEDATRKCIAARIASKGYNTNRAQVRNEMMVREYVYPEYVYTTSVYKPNAILYVYRGDQRRTLVDLAQEFQEIVLASIPQRKIAVCF